jgi:hypothetical protein
VMDFQIWPQEKGLAWSEDLRRFSAIIVTKK